MKQFMCEDFLLNTETAKKLYHDYAKNIPIYDFHCHLNPKEIFENKKYKKNLEYDTRKVNQISLLKRMDGIKCGYKDTSCPDQLAKALKEYKKDNE